MSDTFASLETEYCPPLDPALLTAILYDFNLNDNVELATARETLDSLKTSALEEEATAFDPSGSTVHFGDEEDNGHSERGASSAVHSEDTNLTSLSNGVHSLDLGTMKELDEDFEKLDEGRKTELLKEMFPTLNEFTVLHTLRKCGNNWNRVIEELLNHEFFDGQSHEDGEKISRKGIDAFYNDNTTPRGRKKRDKRKNRTLDDDASRSSSLSGKADPGAASPWETARRDVDFISSRTKLSPSIVSSTYHQNASSVPATITSLLDSSPLSNTAKPLSTDPIVQAHASELGKEFPSVSQVHLTTLIRLTHPSTAAAHELAKAMISRRPAKRGGIEVITRYAPVNLSSDDEASFAPSRSSRSGISTPVTSVDPATLAAGYSLAQQRVYTQASAAYRRGRSDHLMGAAAAYYSQLGRDYAALRVEATADAADELVAGQSSRSQVDLHGVTVKDAVRIARQKTEAWWRQGGAKKAMGFDGRVVDEGQGRQGFRIVTGVGRHSEGGRAKIGPAVGRMLMQEGWKVTIGEGVFTVTGKSL